MPEPRAGVAMRRASVALGLVSAAWPLLAYACAGRLSPRTLLLGIGSLWLLRLWLGRRGLGGRKRIAALALAGALAALAATVFFGGPEPGWISVKLYPCAVSVGLLAVFGLSLVFPPSAVERIARLREPALPPEAVGYTRAVTAAWCLFFACNGSIAALTAVFGSDRAWALYNGVIAYALMGAMFAGEMLVRRHAMARRAAAAAGGGTDASTVGSSHG